VRWLLVLFVVVPLVELYLLLWIGSFIGFWPTVAIVLGTGLLGSALAKREGIKVWRAWRRSLETFTPPEQGVVDGVLVLIGGALLITPGVLTDMLGLMLLVPTTRGLVAARVRRAIDRRIAAGQIHVMQNGLDEAWGVRPDVGADVVETHGEETDAGRDGRQPLPELPPPGDEPR
jgi:UPF0716 protein FxsA